MVGRQVSLWHGDVSGSARQRIMRERPDCLLITPESLEVILVSRRWDKSATFGNVRAVIVDEIHAFAGDDRGWHLLALLERIGRVAGREIQRIGLSATVGNPDALLRWLADSCDFQRRVIAPEPVSKAAKVTLDHVGSLDNAAVVISRLHRREKRLVFCDSRSEVEALGRKLRQLGVDTYLSHSSLSSEERSRAESAFAVGTDCVIVSTSTLELGVDVGDLDRVIQVGAPWSVSSFLQRLGRTGRRPGTNRNCLFLTTTEDAFLRAAGIARLCSEGYVEAVEPPPMPLHLLAQQIMALALQQGGIGIRSWQDWIGRMPGFVALESTDVDRVVRYMIDSEIMSQDAGILWFGVKGESRFGRRNFMDLLSSFTSEPLFLVRYGRQQLGSVDRRSFTLRHDKPSVLLLAGHSWTVNHIDWRTRTVFVEPSMDEGKSRWLGSGQPLSFELCQTIKRILGGDDPACEISKRASATLNALRVEFEWCKPGETALVGKAGQARWWTFGGLLANSTLAGTLRRLQVNVGGADNLAIRIEDRRSVKDWDSVMAELRSTPAETIVAPVEPRAITDLKFSDCLPEDLAIKELEVRLTDRLGAVRLINEKVTIFG
jgi:ATP-dependent Lhr-like helicase